MGPQLRAHMYSEFSTEKMRIAEMISRITVKSMIGTATFSHRKVKKIG